MTLLLEHTSLSTRRHVGRAFLAAGLSWVVYLVLAFTLSAGYEEALIDASEATDTPVNRLPAEVLSEISRDHPWSNVSAVLLLLVPALLIVATRRTREVTGAVWPERLAWAGGVVWWGYMLLNFGLLLGPDDLPPLTRDLDVLTAPLVSAGSRLALLAFIGAAWSLRRHGWRPVASTVAAGLAAALLLVFLVAAVASGWDEPVAPVGLLPAELVLGIALLVGSKER